MKEEFSCHRNIKFKRNYYVQLYTNRLDNLEKVNKFLDIYHLQRLNHGGIKSKEIIRKQTESVPKSSPSKIQDPTSSQLNSMKHLMKN